MTQKELISKISSLPITQQVEILNVILQLVADDLKASGGSGSSRFVDEEIGWILALRASREGKEGFPVVKELYPPASEVESEAQADMRLSQRLYGILKFDGEPPTDDEIKDSRADYLMEKYS
jgi:hypothetical protein